MKCATKQPARNKAPQSSTNDTGQMRQEVRNNSGSYNMNVDDGLLAGIVRNGSPRIIASLLASASRCGDQHDWQEMSEYQNLAHQLTVEGGLQRFLIGGSTMSMMPQAMAAVAAGNSSGGPGGGT